MVFILIAVAGAVQAGFEIPTVADTNYAVPPGALFVATDGSDDNSGSEAEPLATIGAAIQAAASGGAIVIREGTYREGDHTFTKALTLQPYPHETVWLKGSMVVTDWVPAAALWRHDNWLHEFNDATYDPGAIDPAYPHAGKPDLMFVDGQPLAQVGNLTDVTADTFYVDNAANRLYIGIDPGGRTIEAAVHQRALRAVNATADGTIIRGLGFMHYAGGRFTATLQCDNARTTFENNTIAWSASRGLAAYNATDTIVRGNTLIYNGQMGLAAWQTHGMLVENNRLAGNNQEHFVLHGAVAEASGAKITVSDDLIIRDNVIEDNLATGLWLDISIVDATIVGNIARNNMSFGIFYEISARAVIAGNVLVGNLDAGIAVSNSSQVQVYNNTLVDNQTAIAVFDDARVNQDPDEIDQGITWITTDIVLKNNILSNSDGISPLLFVRDYNSVPLQDADDLIADTNFNAYYRTQSANPGTLIEWWRGTQIVNYPDVTAFQADTGFASSSLGIDDITPSPFFVDEAAGNYQLLAGSIARGAGDVLPTDVAVVLGLPNDSVVDLGAIQFAGTCTSDLNSDGAVGADDLAILLGAWGNPGCSSAVPCGPDLDMDGDVDAGDLAQLLGGWGPC